MKTASFVLRSRILRGGLAFVGCVLPAIAQVDTGTILGNVTDRQGRTYRTPGSRLLTSLPPRHRHRAPLRTDGLFSRRFPLAPTPLTVEAGGFKKATVQSVHLDIQQQALVNVSLQPGAVTENVEVTEAPELMQTESSSVGQVIDEKAIVGLPLNGRDYTMLVLVTPGRDAATARRAREQSVCRQRRARGAERLSSGRHR